jgi:hypothetical protein
MVALVFIGIVTAGMVKATGGQSRATISYGDQLVMASTVNSGIIATETYLRDKDNAKRVARMIDSAINTGPNPTNTFLWGTSGTKQPLADGQAFSSRIDTFIVQDNYVVAVLDVRAGRHKDDLRDLRRATVYGRLGKISTGGFGDNALFSNGNIGHINAHLNVTGNVYVGGDWRLPLGSTITGTTRVDGELWLGGTSVANLQGGHSSGTLRTDFGTTLNGAANTNIVGVKEPKININNIPPQPAVTRLGRNDINMTSPNDRFDFDKFKTAVANVPPTRRYNGTHVVIELTSKIQIAHAITETFNDNVIFILTGNGEIDIINNHSFYGSDPGFSTMIYLGPGSNPRLHGFSTPANSTFRGYIHIAEGNTGAQQFRPSADSNFEGAIHHWGTGQLSVVDNTTLNLKHNPDILNNFAGLIDGNSGGGGGEKKFVFAPNDTAIHFQPFGFYFH